MQIILAMIWLTNGSFGVKQQSLIHYMREENKTDNLSSNVLNQHP
jgi:hypothetical protein